MGPSPNLNFRLSKIQISGVDGTMELLGKIAFWFAIAAALSSVWGALLWEIWEGVVRLRMLPQKEIDALARQMIAEYGQRAADSAFANEDRAWRYSDRFERAKWRRVRLATCRMAL